MSPGKDQRPEAEGNGALSDQQAGNLKSGSTVAHRTDRIACPCGCLAGVDCVTERPAPEVSQFCCCSGLGIEYLRTEWAVRWHASGHPEFRTGVAA